MALVPVRSKQPVAGETFVTEVSEEWLERWPEDFDRLEGEELVRYQLAKSGLGAFEIETALPAVLASETSTTAIADIAPSTAPADDALDATVADEPPATAQVDVAPHPVAVDPTASSD